MAALTRIRNNQVYNSDIHASSKIVPGSITGSLLSPTLTFTGNLTVGNLTVNGNTTSLDTISVVSADPIVILNRNFSGSNTYDVGLILGRGNQTNTAMLWDETNKQFSFIYTSATTNASYYGSVPNSGYANIQAYGGLFNNVTSTTSTITNLVSGNAKITGGTLNNITIGATTANSGVFTTLTATSGYQGAASGPINGTVGATTPNSGVFTTLTASSGYQGAASGPLNGTLGATTPNSVVATSVTTTSGGQVTGYITGPIGANTANSGVFTSVTTTSGGQLTGYLTGAIGANTANTGAFTTLTASTSITAGSIQLWSGNNTITGASISGTSTGAAGPLNGTLGATTPNSVVATSVTTTSGGQVTGYITGPVGANTANTGVFTTLTSNTSTANSYVALNGGQVTGYLTGPVGANTANTGVFTTLTATSGYQGAASGPLNGTIGATTPNSGVFTTLTATGQANINTITAATIAAGTIGNTSAVFTGASITLSSTSQAGSYTTTGGGQVTGYITGPIGSNTANTGAFTTVTSTSTITATGNIVANSGVASTTTTTGALTVNGGVGVSGAFNVGAGLNLQGNGYITTNQATASVFTGTNAISIGSSIGNTTVNNGLVATGNTWINSAGVAGNLIVQGNTTAGYSNLLVTNGFTGQVGVKVAPGSIPTSASFQVNSTDSMIVPKGTTGQRPSGGNEVAGMLRFNSSTGFLEFWSGTQWATGGATFTTVTSDSFTGDGTTTAFTLSQASTTAGVIVLINGIAQIPTTAYSVSSTTLTFTEAPLATDIIDARTIVTTTQVSSLNDGTTYIVVANTAAVIYASVQSSNVWVANTSTYFNGGISAFNSNISLSPSTLTTVDTFSKTKFRSAKYIVTVSDFANTKYQTAEVLVVHDGTTAYATQYGVMSTTGTSFVTYAASVSGSNVILQANSTSSVSYCSVQQIYNAV